MYLRCIRSHKADGPIDTGTIGYESLLNAKKERAFSLRFLERTHLD